MLKKILSLVMIVLLMLSFVACKPDDDPPIGPQESTDCQYCGSVIKHTERCPYCQIHKCIGNHINCASYSLDSEDIDDRHFYLRSSYDYFSLFGDKSVDAYPKKSFEWSAHLELKSSLEFFITVTVGEHAAENRLFVITGSYTRVKGDAKLKPTEAIIGDTTVKASGDIEYNVHLYSNSRFSGVIELFFELPDTFDLTNSQCEGCLRYGVTHSLCEDCGKFKCMGNHSSCGVKPETCPGCNSETAKHSVCNNCGKYLCVGDHSACVPQPIKCPGCGTEGITHFDCSACGEISCNGRDHSGCATCGEPICAGDHGGCDACGQRVCNGKNHGGCIGCGLPVCSGEHGNCTSCGEKLCNGESHDNCADCGKPVCSGNHGSCEHCGKAICTGDHSRCGVVIETCPGCGTEGVTHLFCEICAKRLCVEDEHAVCTECQCKICDGRNHSACSECREMLCNGKPHAACSTCGDKLCNGYDHSACPTCGGKICNGDNHGICPTCDGKLCNGADHDICGNTYCGGCGGVNVSHLRCACGGYLCDEAHSFCFDCEELGHYHGDFADDDLIIKCPGCFDEDIIHTQCQVCGEYMCQKTATHGVSCVCEDCEKDAEHHDECPICHEPFSVGDHSKCRCVDCGMLHQYHEKTECCDIHCCIPHTHSYPDPDPDPDTDPKPDVNGVSYTHRGNGSWVNDHYFIRDTQYGWGRVGVEVPDFQITIILYDDYTLRIEYYSIPQDTGIPGLLYFFTGTYTRASSSEVVLSVTHGEAAYILPYNRTVSGTKKVKLNSDGTFDENISSYLQLCNSCLNTSAELCKIECVACDIPTCVQNSLKLHHCHGEHGTTDELGSCTLCTLQAVCKHENIGHTFYNDDGTAQDFCLDCGGHTWPFHDHSDDPNDNDEHCDICFEKM